MPSLPGKWFSPRIFAQKRWGRLDWIFTPEQILRRYRSVFLCSAGRLCFELRAELGHCANHER